MKSQGQKMFIAIICADLLVVLAILVVRSINELRTSNNAVQNTAVTETAPGIVIHGSVRNSSEKGVENVAIYAEYAGIAGELVAVTDSQGNYETKFYTIPGDEMVTVWAQRTGLQFQPENCFWRHYYGYEMKTCDFLVQPILKSYLPLISKSNK